MRINYYWMNTLLLGIASAILLFVRPLYEQSTVVSLVFAALLAIWWGFTSHYQKTSANRLQHVVYYLISLLVILAIIL